MSPQFWPAVLGLVVTVLSPLIEPVGTAPLTLHAGSRIWVTGTSTVKSWACSATRFDLAVDATKPNAASAVVAGEKAVGAVDLKVPIAAMYGRPTSDGIGGSIDGSGTGSAASGMVVTLPPGKRSAISPAVALELA